MSTTVLSRRALNRALLARQLLLDRHDMSAVAAIEHLGGIQAQAPNPPYVGLWSRLAGFRHEELADALIARDVVRIVLMRATIHLVSGRDCLAWRPLVQPVLDRWVKTFTAKLPGVDLDEVVTSGRELVDAAPRTLKELGVALGERWPGHDPSALTAVVRGSLPLVQLPPRGIWNKGGQATHTSAENWLGSGLADIPSIDDMVLRYLGAFGPASVKDVQVWSGITRLREVIDRLRPELVSFRDELGVELFDLPGAPRPDPETPAPARFLAEFDNTLLSYADRGRIVAQEHRPLLFTANGIIPGAVLVDGFVHGSWKLAAAKDNATLTIQQFRPVSRADRAALTEEGNRLIEFVAPGAENRSVEFTRRSGRVPQ